LNLWNHYVKQFTTRDWCISRQLWSVKIFKSFINFVIIFIFFQLFKRWGQQIPAYKCQISKDDKQNFKWIAAHNEKEARQQASEYFSKSNNLNQIIEPEQIYIQQGVA
jgi:valyl-tRNA synthetase